MDRALVLLPLASPFVAVLTYWLGYRHKERDRRFDLYNQSVIVPSLDDLEQFFTKYREKLIEYARSPAAISGGTAIPRASTKLYGEFSSDLYAMKDGIAARVEIYDRKTVGRIEDIVGSFDTKVTQKLISRVPREEQTINEILLNAKREMTRTIYKCNLEMLKQASPDRLLQVRWPAGSDNPEKSASWEDYLDRCLSCADSGRVGCARVSPDLRDLFRFCGAAPRTADRLTVLLSSSAPRAS